MDSKRGTAWPARTERLDFPCVHGSQDIFGRDFSRPDAGKAAGAVHLPERLEEGGTGQQRRCPLGGRPGGGGAGLQAGRGKGRARRASGSDGSAEGRCEAPARREPWREAAPRRPHQCPGPQQRPRPPPRGPPGRRLRVPRASDGRALRVRRPGRGAARGTAAQEGARGSRSAPTNPASQNPGPGAREHRVGGRAAERGAGAPAEPAACAPVPPGRLLWREPEPPGGRDWAEDNEEEAARRADRLGSPAPEAPRIAPATGPRSVRLSRVPCEEPLPVCPTSWGLSARLPQTPAAGPPMAVGTSP
ncbi:collagen alpha-1(I) chain-like [Bubalus kerabau]|uniref:collagen alpha-1(I) chain-like n=1 Tax=Bubalus carabanensis TaxID=3119969 RepID=UPI00244EA172|nr:collagen alpha-1(I) chain-like [Bubalus carabanensis]